MGRHKPINRARHPYASDRERASGYWTSHTTAEDRHINGLTLAEQAHVVQLFESAPHEFKEWMKLWRARNPGGTFDLAAMLGSGIQQNTDFSSYTPEDFAQVNLAGVRFNNPRFADTELFKTLKEGGAKFGGSCTIGDRVLQPPVTLDRETRNTIETVFQHKNLFGSELARIRALHSGRTIDLGKITLFFCVLDEFTPHDFRDLQLSGMSIGDVSLSPELHDFLLSKGVEFTGYRKIGEDRFIPVPLSATSGIDTLLSDENREGFLNELDILNKLRSDPLQLINLGYVRVRFANLSKFQPDDFKGCILRGMELSNVDVTSTLKQFFDRAGAKFVNGVTVDGKKLKTPDQERGI